MERKLRIGVRGSRQCDADISRIAESVGRGVPEHGAVLICGGGGGGMEAAARGASEAGGLVVGILPDDTAAKADRWVELPIVTGMGNARNAINLLAAHSIIAIAGGPGTLSEIALAIKVGTPAVGLRTWDAVLDGNQLLAPVFQTVTSPEDAVQLALSLAKGRLENS
jgi:uncharacterized protein (TIGR00725 family)